MKGVKKLRWEKYRDGIWGTNGFRAKIYGFKFEGEVPYANYTIAPKPCVIVCTMWIGNRGYDVGQELTIEKAMDVCQRDYEKRISANLERS